MKIFKNNKNVDLKTLHQQLKKRLSKYEYEFRDELLIVRKNKDIQYNIQHKSDGIYLTESVPVMYRIGGIIILFTPVAFLGISLDWALWLKVIAFAIMFVASGFIADGFYRLSKRNDFKGFREDVFKTIEQITD